MKITLSRRQRAFFAKWGGVVLAAILVMPIAFFGGTYLMANSRIDATLAYVTQDVRLFSLEPIGPTDELPPDAVYRVILSVNNDTLTPADVTVTDASISLGNYYFDIVGSAGWHGTVPAKTIVIFEGDIVVPRAVSRDLDGKNVPINVEGEISAKVRYAFVERQDSRRFKSSTEGIIPRPTTPTPTEITEPPPTTTQP